MHRDDSSFRSKWMLMFRRDSCLFCFVKHWFSQSRRNEIYVFCRGTNMVLDWDLSDVTIGVSLCANTASKSFDNPGWALRLKGTIRIRQKELIRIEIRPRKEKLGSDPIRSLLLLKTSVKPWVASFDFTFSQFASQSSLLAFADPPCGNPVGGKNHQAAATAAQNAV